MFSDMVDELTERSDTDLVARIEANELARRRLDAEMSALLATAKVRSVHSSRGHRTMTAFCRATLNWSTAEAGRRLSMARAANEVPGLGDAWAGGRFGQAQALKLAVTHANSRVCDRLPEFVRQLLLHAEQMPYSDFADVVDHFVDRADEDGAHDDRDAAVEGRRARVVGVGGSLDVRASGGDGLVADEMVSIFDRFTDVEFRRDLDAVRAAYGSDADAHPLPRTDRQRRFDALVAIFRAGAEHRGVATPASEPLVNVNIDSHTFGRMLVAAGLSTATSLDGRPIDPFTGLSLDDTDQLRTDLTDPTHGICRTTNGVSLHTHDVLRAALAGHVRRVVVDAESVVIDMGRKQRLFTGNARRAAKQLVRRCEHTGCGMPTEWCEIDHVDEWGRDDGRTDQSNAAVLCRFHNNDKHHHRWRTRRATNGCSDTIDAAGTIVLPVGARKPDFDPPDVSTSDDPDDSPDEIARLTLVARNRVAALRHPNCAAGSAIVR